jgi:thiamine-monophosphate kinase
VKPGAGFSEPLALGPGAEFDRIRGIARALGGRARGLGDDCALLPDGSGVLALSTDVSVEGVHFRLDWIELAEIGWRAAAAGLSDLAAEGAQPLGVLSAITVPAGATEEDLVEVAGGIGAATAAVSSAVLGGDLSRGPVWSVTVTVIGRAEPWRRGEVPPDDARRAFARPQPRISAGRWLAAHGARAMLDLSDGLAADAAHLAAASDVRLHLTLETVPVAPAAIAEARRLGLPVQQFAAQGGEDFELLVALPPEFGEAGVREFEAACGLALTRVGTVERGSGVRAELLGRRLELQGYDHFR